MGVGEASIMATAVVDGSYEDECLLLLNCQQPHTCSLSLERCAPPCCLPRDCARCLSEEPMILTGMRGRRPIVSEGAAASAVWPHGHTPQIWRFIDMCICCMV